MSQSEGQTPTTSRPTSPESLAETIMVEFEAHQSQPLMDDESDAVLIASADSSSDERSDTIESTSEVDWSRVRTRAETVISDDDDESGDENSTLRSEEDGSFDMMTPSQSLELQSAPSRTTGTSGSVLSLEDAQSSIDAFFTNHPQYTSIQSNKLRFWQALCVEFGLVNSSSNPLPSFSDLGIISEDSEIDSTVGSTSLSSNASVSGVFTSTASSSGPSSSTRATNQNNLPPLPTSLRQAKILLENEAHVNLVDYVAGRQNTRLGRGIANGRPRNFAHLVYPSRKSLIKYTRKTGKIYPREDAKSEWLNPMLEKLYGKIH